MGTEEERRSREAAQRQLLHVAPIVPGEHNSVVPPAWPLVGRHEELELIEQFMGRPAPPASVMLSGAAGVGKTRLAREALDLARSRGLATEWAAATSASATIPFGAVAHLVPEDLLVPARPGLLRGTARALTERADGRRMVIAIDDAHLLDDSSAALIYHLASTRTVSIIASIRTGDDAPDAVVALWKDELADRIELQPLSRNEVALLLEEVLGATVDGAGLQRLWTWSQGNVLFLRELVLG
ncbi:MAG: ATP-binding protein, partial [Actinomycetota bacterium]